MDQWMTPIFLKSNIRENKMNRFEGIAGSLKWIMGSLMVALVAGCGGGGSESPILGSGGVAPLTPSTLVDVIKPRVAVTLPANGASVAPVNASITATFTKAMLAATLNSPATNFTVVDTTASASVTATSVTYDTASKTAIFKHATDLIVGHTYAATIKGTGASPATDVARNALAGGLAGSPNPTVAADYVWTFVATAADATAPAITLENPANGATGVVLNASVNATFSKDMDPTTINGTSFTLTGPGPTAVTGVVSYAAGSRIATFTPSSNLAANTTYTATVTVAATDLSNHALAAGAVVNPWTFTTGATLAAGPIALGTASTFGIMATSAITNTGAATMINGDVSLNPGTSNGLLPVQVNGTIHINDTVSAQARTDLLTAYNAAKALAPGTTVPGGQDLGAFSAGAAAGTLPPGTYTSGSTMYVNTPVTLDAGGNANAVWVFQIGSSLTTNTPTGNVVLANGAQAKNVFWVPTASATIGVNTTFYGTVIAGVSVTGQTGAVINGRLLAGATSPGTIALDTNTVTVP